MNALPNVSSRFGAPMGRRGVLPQSLANAFALCALPGTRVRLVRVPLDRGGYDGGGAYWGSGEPLWRAWFADKDGDERESFFRSPDRDSAKAQLPGCRFFQ